MILTASHKAHSHAHIVRSGGESEHRSALSAEA